MLSFRFKEEISKPLVQRILKEALQDDFYEKITVYTNSPEQEAKPAKLTYQIEKNGEEQRKEEKMRFSFENHSLQKEERETEKEFSKNEDIREKILSEGDNFWDKTEYLLELENQIFVKNMYHYWSEEDRIVLGEVTLMGLDRAASNFFFNFYWIFQEDFFKI